MTAHDFLALRRADPFQPFRVVFTNDDAHDVPHPTAILVLRDRVVVGADFGADGIPGRTAVRPLADVVRVEPLG